MNSQPKIIGVVLAGGKSSRMGEDKSLLKLNGITLLKKAQETLQEIGCHNIIISRADHVPDTYPNQGPMGGICTILGTQQDGNLYIFIAVDMPMVQTADLRMLTQHLQNNPTCVAAYFAENPLPFAIFNVAKNVPHTGSVKRFLQNIQATELPTHSPCLTNLNTPQDWQKFLQEKG